MYRVRQTITMLLALTMVSLGLAGSAEAQRRPYRINDRQVDTILRRIETNADRFRVSVDAALDRSRLNGTASEDQINNFIRDFEQATDTLRSRFNGRTSVAADVENVLSRAAYIDQFMTSTRLSNRAQSDWQLLRTDLDALANAYSVTWDWNRVLGPVGPVAGGVSQQPYRLGDREVDTIIRRIEQNTDRFRTSLDAGLDRSRWDGTRAENNINNFVRDFEQATDRLRTNFNGRRSVDADVENVLSRAASIDRFVRDNRLNTRVQNDWNLVRTDLSTLADAYGVAWNWSNPTAYPNQYPNANPNANPTNAANRLTGTFRLNPSQSDTARDVADRATSTLPAGDRQRIADRLLTRLESPEELAIERRGRTVIIASTRAQQTTFEADGVERTEQLPNGRTSRVVSTIQGDRLEVRSTGFRENDFVVTFDPIEAGRRLRVTRQIFSDRFTQPVVAVNVYDRTSDVARFDIYNSSTAGYQTEPGRSYPSGEFIIRDGERVIAVLDNDLSTRNLSQGDRFTMTVREPAAYAGAVIEGQVAGVERGGRVTGRSQISFDFDTIRFNGRNSSFAGFVESVTTTSGETVRVDNEGSVRDSNQTDKTVTRTAIGSAVGAIIGAIAGGGKGAAIGAVVGAGAGAGSVYVQGRDDLDLLRGTEFNIRASAPNR
jgi:hypothetical protein